ncbi:hypothetical protein T265_01477 [Opisthorchis viverrini]|uniref:Dynein light chain n=1 Tax=Opisthorchis viverrini TaxID=6198 RepID=A0A075A2D8_OPIVI|nr:hypothetical protein T265_01477 [Opisthorchis viverrini]KER32422.1 hypothetical protein T265_01477 [Opisthorchis viverrini]
MDERKAVIKVCELDERVADEAIHEAAYALDKYQDSKDVADHLKKYFDKKYERTWHCIIGNNFGSQIPVVTYKTSLDSLPAPSPTVNADSFTLHWTTEPFFYTNGVDHAARFFFKPSSVLCT